MEEYMQSEKYKVLEVEAALDRGENSIDQILEIILNKMLIEEYVKELCCRKLL
jgi:hypothetical protein